MKKIIVLILAGIIAASLCVSCVTREDNSNGYASYKRNREAAQDATRRMNEAHR